MLWIIQLGSNPQLHLNKLISNWSLCLTQDQLIYLSHNIVHPCKKIIHFFGDLLMTLLGVNMNHTKSSLNISGLSFTQMKICSISIWSLSLNFEAWFEFMIQICDSDKFVTHWQNDIILIIMNKWQYLENYLTWIKSSCKSN